MCDEKYLLGHVTLTSQWATKLGDVRVRMSSICYTFVHWLTCTVAIRDNNLVLLYYHVGSHLVGHLGLFKASGCEVHIRWISLLDGMISSKLQWNYFRGASQGLEEQWDSVIASQGSLSYVTTLADGLPKAGDWTESNWTTTEIDFASRYCVSCDNSLTTPSNLKMDV